MAAPRGRPAGGRGGADCGGLGEAGAAAATAAAAGRRVATVPVHRYPPVASAAAVGGPRRRALGRREGQGGRTRQAVGHPPRDTQHGGRLCYKCSSARGPGGGEPCSVCTTLTASGERRPHQPPATPVEALRGRLHTLPFSPAGGWCRPRVRHAPPPAAAHPPPPADAPRGRLDRFPPPGDSRQRLGSNTDGGGEECRHRELRATLQHPLGARCLDQLSPAGGRPISVWGEYRWGGGAPCCRAPRHPHGDPARARLYKGGGGMRFQPTWGKKTAGRGRPRHDGQLAPGHVSPRGAPPWRRVSGIAGTRHGADEPRRPSVAVATASARGGLLGVCGATAMATGAAAGAARSPTSWRTGQTVGGGLSVPDHRPSCEMWCARTVRCEPSGRSTTGEERRPRAGAVALCHVLLCP